VPGVSEHRRPLLLAEAVRERLALPLECACRSAVHRCHLLLRKHLCSGRYWHNSTPPLRAWWQLVPAEQTASPRNTVAEAGNTAVLRLRGPEQLGPGWVRRGEQSQHRRKMQSC
jgi:hypothetical protein